MLNPFPHLLVYSFYAPTLLRLAASLTLLYAASLYWKEKRKLIGLRVPIVGTFRAWMWWVSIIVCTLVALCLFVGYETQIAAIAGMIIALKHLWAQKYVGQYLALSRVASILLFVICLSLLFSGAGAMALDLPL